MLCVAVLSVWLCAVTCCLLLQHVVRVAERVACCGTWCILLRMLHVVVRGAYCCSQRVAVVVCCMLQGAACVLLHVAACYNVL